ncbi:MAG: 2-phospho-L-lactate transferase [Thaumarchaeota archaeon]|nr:2-phospho-L-lactate transferase [Nitrososphaerota archaeon]
MKVTALAGGTGSAKLLRGLVSAGADLTVVANVGDNIWLRGLYVCPDVDIAMYALAGIADRKKGWGIEGDSFHGLEQYGRLGGDGWFALGDMDLATHMLRTEFLRSGMSLTWITKELCRRLHVRQCLLPATDSDVETRIRTTEGAMHLQEFWVMRRGRPKVAGVEYPGASKARITSEVRSAIKDADKVVVCPANPVTSIGPMLALPGMKRSLAETRGTIIAVTPMKGSGPFSGPAGKLMKAVGVRPDSLGVAKMHAGFLDAMVIDRSDKRLVPEISRLGVKCLLDDIGMEGPAGEKRLAKVVLSA